MYLIEALMFPLIYVMYLAGVIGISYVRVRDSMILFLRDNKHSYHFLRKELDEEEETYCCIWQYE